MRARIALLLLVAITLAAGSPARAGQLTDDEQRALRDRVQARYDVVPLTDGVALRPKKRGGDVRLIEIAEGAIAINGTTVTGRELRERVGDDADVILRLSYLSPAEYRALFEEPRTPAERPADAERRAEAEREPDAPDTVRPSMRTYGERVRVFGDVTVARDEQVAEAVAVFGSVKVDGEVRQEVVSVFGSVELGPEAVVNGDVVAVGGRVHKAEGARTRGSVTEVSLAEISLGDPDFRMNVPPWFRGWGGPLHWFGGGFGSVPRLIGTIVRLGLILLVAGIALLVARPAVEGAAQRVADNPVKATLVGLAAQLLILPVMLLTALVLVITVIGIPLLVLLPFLLLLLVLMAVVGFTGTASAIGGALMRRFGMSTPTPFIEIVTGIVVILSPLLIGRMLAVAGWSVAPIAILFVTLGFFVELLAWSSGFGAALTNSFTRWRARRAMRRNGPAMAATPAP
jgi:hypothetical protein